MVLKSKVTDHELQNQNKPMSLKTEKERELRMAKEVVCIISAIVISATRNRI